MLSTRRAISYVDRRHALLVYPIKNLPEPPSLWAELFPATPMRWEWDESGDDRVAELWHLRAELSRSTKVVYAKWYQGRATFFSRALFPLMVAVMESARRAPEQPDAREVLGVLEGNSPLSARQVRAEIGWTGREGTKRLEGALRELWRGLYIVGFGEIDDGAFPSLALGGTQT